MSCKNCNNSLQESDHYCNNCGAKVIDNKLTFGYLFSEFTERFLNIENNLIARTYKNMFMNPADVIDGFINGVRKRYIGIANYLALALTVTGLQLFIMQRFFPKALELPEFMRSQPNALGDNFMNSFFEYQSIWYLILIPVYAFIGHLVFINIKKYNYVEHIVIMGYAQAQLSLTMFIPMLIVSAMGISIYSVSYITIIVTILYMGYCYRSIYKMSMKRIIGKTFVFLGYAILVYIVLIIIMVIIMFASGGMQEVIDAEKAKQGVSYIVSSARNWTS